MTIISALFVFQPFFEMCPIDALPLGEDVPVPSSGSPDSTSLSTEGNTAGAGESAGLEAYFSHGSLCASWNDVIFGVFVLNGE